MQNYQLIFVMPDSLSEEEVKKTQEKIKKLLPDTKAKEDFWGRKKLAYRIGKNDFGYYSTFSFQAETDAISLILKKLRLSEDIIRFMINKTTKEEPKEIKEKKVEKKPEAAAKPIKEKQVTMKKAIKKAAKPKLTTEIETEEKKMEELDKKLDEILKE